MVSRFWKELHSRGERHNIQNWSLEEWALGLFLELHGSIKCSKTRGQAGKNLHIPRAVRGLNDDL